MAQHDYVIANGTGAAVRSDLNNALAAIVSQNSGATAPATTYAFQFWADTTTGLLKLRNSANSAWVTLFQLDGEWSTLPVENGTAAAPSIYFKDSGTDTGFYSPGTDQIGISTAGTSRLTIDANGNLAVDTNTLYVDAPNNRVGIGTSSPSCSLDVRTATSAATVNIQGGTAYGQLVLTDGGSGSNYIDSANSNLRIRTNNSSFIQLQTNNTTAVHIDSSQRVGIGTTSPSGQLSVTFNGNSVQGIVATDTGTPAAGNYYLLLGSSGGIQNVASNEVHHSAVSALAFRTGSGNGSERARIDSSGRLLVGTSTARSNIYLGGGSLTPQTQFEYVANSYNSGLSLINYSASGYGPSLTLGLSLSNTQGTNTSLVNGSDLGIINFVGNDGTNFRSGAYIYATVDGTPGTADLPTALKFSTTADGASGPTERMRITSLGYVKAANSGTYVDVTGAKHEFHTNAADHTMLQRNTHGSTPYGLRIDYTSDPNNTIYPFLFCASNTNTVRAEIRSNGGLANYQANNVNFSDRNAKKDISPAAGTWDCIKEWEIVNYRYKDQPDDADLNLGVIAQQVAENCPEVITVFKEATEDQPKMLGVKEQQMYWMAIKALQEAQVRIEALEAEVAALKAQ